MSASGALSLTSIALINYNRKKKQVLLEKSLLELVTYSIND